MRPEDDSTWPRCGEHHDPTVRHWCDWTRAYLLEGRDADDISHGLRYCVPIVPTQGWYAEVSIDTEVIGGISAALHLIKELDPFGVAEEEVYLGLWTVGEGRSSMASTINEWCIGQPIEKCTFSSHGFEQEMQFQAMLKSSDKEDKQINRWCLAYYGCCSFCYIQRDVAQQGAQGWTAAEFGLNGSNFQNTANTASGARTQNIMSHLQQRYGSRTLVDLPNQNFHERP